MPSRDSGQPMTDAASSPRRILAVRNDKLGDFMLAWPALASLKRANGANHITVLVPGYTAALARACPWVDEVLVDPGDKAGRPAQRELLETLRQGRFDALLTLFSTPRIGWLGWRAGIPLRLAPATKWAQVFYNRRITQRRSRSEKPEYVYNLELARALQRELGQATPEVTPPYWPLPAEERRAQRRRLGDELGLDRGRPWFFLHPGSGGSAVNLTAAQYRDLAVGVSSCLPRPPLWLLTAGPGEEAAANDLAQSLRDAGLEAHRVPARPDLAAFARTLSAADLFIAGSTGPLHIAGCLDRPTAGFYPAKRSATPLRWQTCNRAEQRLAFSPPALPGQETEMGRIDLQAAAQAIAERIRCLADNEE